MPTQRKYLLTPLTPSMPACPPMIAETIPTLPMTPPDTIEDGQIFSQPTKSAVELAIHVLSTERAALANLETLYQNDPLAQSRLGHAISQIAETVKLGGKLVVTGVGKSGKVGEKLVASFNSLSIQSAFLQPTDALHGDLGMLRPNDTILMITFSGRTPELQLLLPHIPSTITIIMMTSHINSSSCMLLANRSNHILLSAPIHEAESLSFGLSAPTSSTAVALALGDGLALAVAQTLHTFPGEGSEVVFRSNHPGGAIGAATPICAAQQMADIATRVDMISVASPEDGVLIRGKDIRRSAVRSPGGWVRVSPTHIIAPRRIEHMHDSEQIINIHADKLIVVEKTDWISVPGDSSVEEARCWIHSMRSRPRGRTFLKSGTILGIVDSSNEVNAVVEIEDVIGDDLDGT